eukprot:363790-Pyramimonas_sp.AAC.1
MSSLDNSILPPHPPTPPRPSSAPLASRTRSASPVKRYTRAHCGFVRRSSSVPHVSHPLPASPVESYARVTHARTMPA